MTCIYVSPTYLKSLSGLMEILYFTFQQQYCTWNKPVLSTVFILLVWPAWNFWQRVNSRDNILHCLSLSEKDQVMSDLWNQISQEMMILERELFFKLFVMNMYSWVPNQFWPVMTDLGQQWTEPKAATNPMPYANVHKSALSN